MVVGIFLISQNKFNFQSFSNILVLKLPRRKENFLFLIMLYIKLLVVGKLFVVKCLKVEKFLILEYVVCLFVQTVLFFKKVFEIIFGSLTNNN